MTLSSPNSVSVQCALESSTQERAFVFVNDPMFRTMLPWCCVSPTFLYSFAIIMNSSSPALISEVSFHDLLVVECLCAHANVSLRNVQLRRAHLLKTDTQRKNLTALSRDSANLCRGGLWCCTLSLLSEIFAQLDGEPCEMRTREISGGVTVRGDHAHSGTSRGIQSEASSPAAG